VTVIHQKKVTANLHACSPALIAVIVEYKFKNIPTLKAFLSDSFPSDSNYLCRFLAES
jgi:hypothetical protein